MLPCGLLLSPKRGLCITAATCLQWGKLYKGFSWRCTWLPVSGHSQSQLLKTIVKSEFSYSSLLRFLMTLIFHRGWQLE